MSTTKKQPAKKAPTIKKPVINLKATEVKADDKTGKTKPDANKPETKKPDSTAKTDSKKTTVTASKPSGPDKSSPPAKKKPAPKKNKGKKGLILVSLAALIAAGLGGAFAYQQYGASFWTPAGTVSQEKFTALTARLEKLETRKPAAPQMPAEAQKTIDDLAASVAALQKIAKTPSPDLANEVRTLAAKLTEAQNTIKSLKADIGKTNAAISGAVAKGGDATTAAVALKSDELSQQISALADKTSAIEKRVATVEAQTKTQDEALAALSNDKTAVLEGTIAGLQTKLNSLTVRLKETENTSQTLAGDMAGVKELQSKLVAAGGNSPGEELARNFTVLRARITSGVPFETELDNVAKLMPQETTLDKLRPYAAKGIATSNELAATLSKLPTTAAVPDSKTEEKTDDSGVWGVLSSKLSSMAKVSKVGETDWEAVMASAVKAAKDGRINAVAEILNNTKGPKPAGTDEWLKSATPRIEADNALDKISQTVMQAITAERS